MESQALASIKKKARKRGQTLVFIDESGLSERPTRVRTWSPRGQTPVLQYRFSWKPLSVIAGITGWRFYFRFFSGAIRSPQIVEFLKTLRQHLPGPLLIVWDSLQAHKSRLVRDYVDDDGAIQLEFLPAYAPELNPTEYIWGYLKTRENRDPELADAIMWRVQDGEITDADAFDLAMKFALIEGFDFSRGAR